MENGIKKFNDKMAMTTNEIAIQTGKRHDTILEDTERMLTELYGIKGCHAYLATYVTKGKTHKCYNLPKNEVLTLVSGYSIPLRAKIIRYLNKLSVRAESVIKSLEVVDYKGNTDGFVFVRGGEPFTSSNIIAEKFEKEHYNVLRDIDNHLAKNSDNITISDFNALNFELVEFIDKKQEARRSYELTEAGFAFIALGFTGAKADLFKVRFIQAFYGIRQALMDRVKAEIVRDILPTIPATRNFVYILSNSENGFLKVGVSNNVEKRIKQLQTGSWATLSMEYKSMVCSNSFNIETAVHQKLVDQRVRGEWFDVDLETAMSLIEMENHRLVTPLSKAYLGGCNREFLKA